MATAEEPNGTRSKPAAALHLLATVGSPIAIVTALLVYYGWVRTYEQARTLGFDAGVLDLSIQDYVLKSVNVLFVPAILILLGATALRATHLKAVAPAMDRPGAAPRIIRAFRHSWLLWVLLAGVVVLLAPALFGVAIAGALSISLLCLLYASALERRTGQSAMSPTGRVLTLLILALALFWTTEQVARMTGRAYAHQMGREPEALVSVTVYSPKRLEIQLPGVRETKIGAPESAYLVRYDGLRLVQRSGIRYFLISEQWDELRPRVIVLKETDAIRLEFSR